MVTTRRSIGVGSSTARATKRRYSVWNGASDPADSDGRRPRPPRLTWPPFRPAERASSGVHSWAVPFACAARPPLLAISFWRSGLIDAKPRRSLRSVEFTFVASSSRSLQMRVASCFRAAARMTQESHAPHSGMPAAHELSATHRTTPAGSIRRATKIHAIAPDRPDLRCRPPHLRIQYTPFWQRLHPNRTRAGKTEKQGARLKGAEGRHRRTSECRGYGSGSGRRALKQSHPRQFRTSNW